MSRLPGHYIVFGAGAVGGTLGALLAEAGHRVTLVGRAALAEAVTRQGGLRHVRAGTTHLVPLEAVADISEVPLHGPPILFMTMKAGDLDRGLDQAHRVLSPTTLTVTWQNGIRAEEAALPVFPNLLGGIVRATSTMLVPGEVRIRTPGLLIVGRYPPPPPGRVDPELDHVVADLVAAGFDAAPSPEITADKGLKLLLNLISGASPLVRHDGGPAPWLTRVETAVLIEGARVLRAAGVPARPASGRGDDVPTMLRHLGERKPRPPADDGVHNSTWQNLALPGRRMENDFMNGEIVFLARQCGIDAPWNQRLLDLLQETRRKGLGPGACTDEELGASFADLTPPASWREEEGAQGP